MVKTFEVSSSLRLADGLRDALHYGQFYFYMVAALCLSVKIQPLQQTIYLTQQNLIVLGVL